MSEEEIKKLVLEFHNTYEELSTEYNYETRKDTRQFDFNSPNGKLMYAVIRKVVIPKIQQKELKEKDKEIERLNNIIKEVRNQLTYLETYSSKEDVFDDMKRRLDRIDKIIGSDKE